MDSGGAVPARDVQAPRLMSRARRWRALRRGLIIGAMAALIGLLSMVGQPFQHTRLWLSDLLYVPGPLSDRIALIAIDDLSLGAYGRSVADWSRLRHAALVDRLSQAGVRVIAFDVLFLEMGEGDTAFATAIERARRSEAGTRVVLAASGKNTPLFTPGQPITYASILAPVDSLRDTASLLGLVNVFPEVDSAVRRVPLLVRDADPQANVPDTLISLGGAAYLAYLRIPAGAISQVTSMEAGFTRLTPQRTIPTDEYGQMTTNYFGYRGTFPAYSFQAVLAGEVDPAVFADKIVLIGLLNATGSADRYLTPLTRSGDLLSGIEIHANILETLLQDRALRPLGGPWDWLLVVGLALGSGALFSQLRWYGILLASTGLGAALFVGASVAFSQWQIVIGLFDPFVVMALSGLGALVIGIVQEREHRTQTQRLLDSATQLGEQRLLLDDVQRQAAIEIERLLGYDGSVIWLWDEDNSRLDCVYWRGGATPFAGAPLDMAARQALDEGQPLRFERGALIPLRFQKRPLGVLGAMDARSDQPIPDEGLGLLALFARNVAPALANARLYTQQRQQKDLLESVLNSAPDPALVLDTARHIRLVNTAARTLLTEMLAVPESEYGSAALVDVLRQIGFPAVDKGQLESLDRALTAGGSFQQDLSFGARHFVLLGAQLRFGQTGWVLTLHDVTALKELDQMRARMLRMASHDLKNPLTVVMGYAEIMQYETQDEDQRVMLEQIVIAGRRMMAIIVDLLNYERIKSGGLQREPVELRETLLAVAEEYRHQAESKGQRLTLSLPEDHTDNLLLDADRRQLVQAIGNLVGNAVKYTPDGGTIAVWLHADPAKTQIVVRDTGYGIPQALQARLFEPFYRAKTAQTEDIPGTGLGLSLVKAVIEAHKGRVTFESEESRGSTFTVELPAATRITLSG